MGVEMENCIVLIVCWDQRRSAHFAIFSNSVLLSNAALFQMIQELAFTISCRQSSTANKCHWKDWFFPQWSPYVLVYRII